MRRRDFVTGLRRLGLPDPWLLPAVADSYGPLAWWISREGRVDVPRFDTRAAVRYPCLVWAEDHFHTSANGLLGNRDYPLTWEAHASQADQEGMASIDATFTEEKLCAPRTWQDAEMFLLLKGVETAP
jgi:hypothetical protein